MFLGAIILSILIITVTVNAGSDPFKAIWAAIQNLQNQIDALTARVVALEQRPLPPEICDNLDNNANNKIDENVIEKEKCGTGNCQGIRERACSAGVWDFWSSCSSEDKACTGGICYQGACSVDSDGDGIPDAKDKCPYDAGNDADGDGYCTSNGDSDDGDPNTYPGAPEICDGKDNNGDGKVDEGCAKAECQIDADCPTGPTKCEGRTYYEMPGVCVKNKCSYGDWTIGSCEQSYQYCGADCGVGEDCPPPGMCSGSCICV